LRVATGRGARLALIGRIAGLAVGLAVTAACVVAADPEPVPAPSSAAWAPSVILISLDGTRPADVTPSAMPNLASLAERGAVAERLVVVSPSNTFPSHVSLVTGVAPERHGIVNNTFEDPERGLFVKKDPDIPSWMQVEPLWSLLERAGVRTAAYYWVGSEGAWPGGRAPSDWRKFSSRTSEEKKVDQILEWIDRPAAERPRLITAWFHGGDRPGHKDGPGAPDVARALSRQDQQIGRLIDGLVERGRLDDTTLVFVSDHGMASADREVDLRTALKKQEDVTTRVMGIGGFATVVLSDRDRADPEVVARVVAGARRLGLQAHRREEAPPAWRVANPRFGDVVVRAPIGTAIVYWGLDIEGFHGYDPETPEMAAIFLALGRGADPGTRLPPVRAVDVAPTALALLGEPVPAWMEGRVVEAIVPAPTSSATLAPADRSGSPERAEINR